MTRRSPAWLSIGFAIALIGVGFKYWQLPGGQAGLPSALLGPGLAAVTVVALLLRAFGTARFWTISLLIAASVPLAVALRWVMAGSADANPGSSLLVDLAMATALGAAAALVGVVIGSLLLLRSSQRPD
ncbi:hypothetical protein [Pseudoxanthomonas dokdonensis]|uniref:Uncharacterized protein n=1 Tax=Pseudoxanthomonas dokdonensis TaxID=344882 RepID=A0A0R0CTT9_9GAMM|nr:hypothetical protein [Pseudoxanthomonas dokdonensis]KRG68296.1 hypothetical protein ABB29_13285 [Pseudoxanthomonas dokdonensis]